jgi:ribose transport system permease protein
MVPQSDSHTSGQGLIGMRFRSLIRDAVRSQVTGVLLILLVGILYMWGTTDTFIQPRNLRNVALYMSWITIAAFGQTLVIITAGIDLSVGSVMALSGIVAAYVVSADKSPGATEIILESGRTQAVAPGDSYVVLAFLAGCGVGMLVGLINGILIAWANLPPFIATLGTMSIARGICAGVTQGETIRRFNATFLEIGRGELTGIAGDYQLPYPSLIMLILAVVISIFLSRTVWGYRIYAVGGNEQASQLSGINTRRTKLLAYTLSGLMGGLAGTLLTSNLGAASADAAKGYELQVIAAVVIGGTSLMGGKGTIFGTLIGAVILFVLRNGLNLLRYDAYWQEVAVGGTIIIAIIFDQLRLFLRDRRLSDVVNLAQWRQHLDTTRGEEESAEAT